MNSRICFVVLFVSLLMACAYVDKRNQQDKARIEWQKGWIYGLV